MRQEPSTLPEPRHVCAFKPLLPTPYNHEGEARKVERKMRRHLTLHCPSSGRKTSFLETEGTKSEGTPPP